MSAVLVVLAALAAPGCLAPLPPLVKSVDRTIGVRWTNPATVGSGAGVLRVAAETRGRTVRVAVAEGGKCRRRHELLVETTNKREWEPAIKTRSVRTDQVERVDCPGPDGVAPVALAPVVLVLPGGARLADRTDDVGVAFFDLAAGDPPAGLATLDVDAGGPRSVAITYGDTGERSFREQRVGGLLGGACRPVEGMKNTFACEHGSVCREGRCVVDAATR